MDNFPKKIYNHKIIAKTIIVFLLMIIDSPLSWLILGKI